jgi:hypothetical protein
MSMREETPLDAVVGPSEQQVRTLTRHGLTTAESVVAVAATPGGLSSLAEALDVPVAEAEQLVAAARAALPENVAAEMEAPTDTSEFGLGALPPPPGPEAADP